MNSLLLISPCKGSGFKPIFSGNWCLVIVAGVEGRETPHTITINS
ncbi:MULTISPECIES: hypothetical protein [unclassified Microcoleus]